MAGARRHHRSIDDVRGRRTSRVAIGQAGEMRHLRRATLPVAAAVLLVACGNDAARGVAVPGAPGAVTTVPPPTSTTSTTLPTTTAVPTTLAPTTIPETTTSAPAPTTTGVAPTTEPPAESTTTAPGPTTTELVYVAEPPTGTLRFGMEGPRSLQLQRDLIQLGFLPAGADDGLYGPGTAGGVRRFQESAGLVIDGVAGPITQAALADAIAAAAAEEPPADE